MLLDPERFKQKQNKFKDTYKILWWCAFQMTICFVVTYMVYPGVAQATKLKFLSGSSSEDTWLVIIISSCFGLFDTVGRYVAEIFPLFNNKNIVIMTVFRLIFIPSFILLAKLDSPSWLFGADYFKLLHCILFGFLNGYHCNRLMVFGPAMVPDELKETAGIVMNWHLVGGIFGGKSGEIWEVAQISKNQLHKPVPCSRKLLILYILTLFECLVVLNLNLSQKWGQNSKNGKSGQKGKNDHFRAQLCVSDLCKTWHGVRPGRVDHHLFASFF